jgi:hypothetical protein
MSFIGAEVCELSRHHVQTSGPSELGCVLWHWSSHDVAPLSPRPMCKLTYFANFCFCIFPLSKKGFFFFWAFFFRVKHKISKKKKKKKKILPHFYVMLKFFILIHRSLTLHHFSIRLSWQCLLYRHVSWFFQDELQREMYRSKDNQFKVSSYLFTFSEFRLHDNWYTAKINTLCFLVSCLDYFVLHVFTSIFYWTKTSIFFTFFVYLFFFRNMTTSWSPSTPKRVCSATPLPCRCGRQPHLA